MTFIELLKYIFLGVIQGITEVLPISSSGHVALSQVFLNIENDEGILFLVLVNFGSLIAIAFHFRKLIRRLTKNTWNYFFHKSTRNDTSRDYHYVNKVILATIPFGILGVMFENQLDIFYREYALFVVAIGLLVTSTFLYIVRFAPEQHVKQELSYKDAFIIGLIQPLSMVPGLSRSGITTSTGLLRKLSMETSLTFSLMLYIPISFGVLVYKLGPWVLCPSTVDIGFDSTDFHQYILYGTAFLFSFLATRFSLKYIFRWFRQGKLVFFAIYTLVLGLLALVIAVMTY